MVRSIIIEATGGPEVLVLGEQAALKPSPGQLLVRTLAVGVNFIEVHQRGGGYPVTLPFVPGSEASGLVVAVGDGVRHFAIGDRITTDQAVGTYADVFVVDEDKAIHVPDGIPDDLAAAIPGQGLTAHYLVRSTYPAQKGDVAVVTAGAGGVGGLTIQLLKDQGATVIAVVGSVDKTEAVQRLGADDVAVGYGDFSSRVRELTGGHGADVVYDSVGKDAFAESMRSLRKRGLLVLFGASSGPVPPLDLQELKKHGSLYATRPTLDDYLLDRHERNWRAGELFDAVMEGSLSVRIAGSYPLAQAPRAHEALQSRTVQGKILLIP